MARIEGEVSDLTRQVRELDSRLLWLEGTVRPPLVGSFETALSFDLSTAVFPPYAHVYNSADINHSTSGDWQVLTYNSERSDTDDIHSTVSNTGRLTCKTAGHYLIISCTRFATNATGDRGVRFVLNGTTSIVQDIRKAAGGAATQIPLSIEYELVAGDYITCDAYQTSGGALNMPAVGNHSPEFMMVW